MIKYFNAIKYLACGVFGFMLAWNLRCSPKCPDLKPVEHTIVVVDSVKVPVPVDKIHETVVFVPKTDTLTKEDTIEAINDFGKLFIYNKNFRDSAIEVSWTDSVTRNAIRQADFSYKILRPTTINTTIITPPVALRNKIFIGAQLGGWSDKFTAAPTILLLTKKDALFSGGYDVVNKEILAGVYIKLHF